MGNLAAGFLTVSETAENPDVSQPTIRRWIRDGDLSADRIGKLFVPDWKLIS